MKKFVSLRLAVLLLFCLCLPVTAGEVTYGEMEGWHYYPVHPVLSTLLEDEDLWIVRGRFTGKENVPDENGDLSECYMFAVEETLRGQVKKELAFRVPVYYYDQALALQAGPDGCADLRPSPNLEYILVLNHRPLEGMQMRFFDPEQDVQVMPHIAFWEWHGFESTANALLKELQAEGVDSLDSLEAFFRENLPKENRWLKPVVLCGTAVAAAVWLGIMARALRYRKKVSA